MNFVDKAHIEKQFINTISFNLELFSWVSNASNTANCRCNICGDSKTKRNKRRLFFYEKNGSFLVHCHNCGYHRSFSNYLKEYFLEYYSKYISELFAHKKKQSLVVDYSLSNKPPLSLQPAVLNYLTESCYS
jgi:ribosomal protein L32